MNPGVEHGAVESVLMTECRSDEGDDWHRPKWHERHSGGMGLGGGCETSRGSDSPCEAFQAAQIRVDELAALNTSDMGVRVWTAAAVAIAPVRRTELQDFTRFLEL